MATNSVPTHSAETIEREESLICEALVKEIGHAQRWSAVKEAWVALLHVRLMARGMKDEQQYLRGGGSSSRGMTIPMASAIVTKKER